MIPIGDLIPTRTRPAASLGVIAAHAAATPWAAAEMGWVPWAVTTIAVWMFSGALEDRMGHGRFIAFWALGAAAGVMAGVVLGSAPPVCAAASGGLAALAAGYFILFPRGRILTIVPVVIGFEFADIPAWAVLGGWALALVAALRGLPEPDARLATMAAVLAGTAAGSSLVFVFRRPERMRVEWWNQ
jgi:membrane associated rhomboid family serine protease